MTITQADVDRWAGIFARAYKVAHRPFLTPTDEASLIRELNTPLAHCLMLAIPSDQWGPDYVDPAFQRWERMTRRGPGPRLRAVDFTTGTVTVG